MYHLIKDLGTEFWQVTTIHGEGSLAAQRISIYTNSPWNRYKAAAKRAAGISDGSEDQTFAQLPTFPPDRKYTRR